jgi:hypothetical protein
MTALVSRTDFTVRGAGDIASFRQHPALTFLGRNPNTAQEQAEMRAGLMQ